MSREVVLLLLLVAGFVASDAISSKVDQFGLTIPIKLPTNFNESFANLTNRKADAEVNLVAVDLLLDAIYDALANEESNVTIPEDIDPEQTPISVQDAVVRVSKFMAEQTREVQDLRSDVDQFRKKLMSRSGYNWLQTKTAIRQKLKVLRLKKAVSNLYRNYTETGDEISRLYDSLPIIDKDFDNDYEYDSSLTSQYDDSGDGGVEDSGAEEDTMKSDPESEITKTTLTSTSPHWKGEEFYQPDVVEDYNEKEDNSDWERVATTTTYTTKRGSFVNPWKTYASEDDSSQGETDTENYWLVTDKPSSTYSEKSHFWGEESNWLFNLNTLSTTTLSTYPFWDSSLYRWDDYSDTDLDENENVLHYTNDDDYSYSSYSDTGIYAGAIIGAVILKITFWVMIIRCRYRYRNRLCYRTTLTVTPIGNVRRVRRVPNAQRMAASTTTTNNAPTPQDNLPTYVEAVANDVPPPPKYEDCQNDTCEVDLATPNDLPAPPAYSSDIPKEENDNTTTSDEVPLISEEV